MISISLCPSPVFISRRNISNSILSPNQTLIQSKGKEMKIHMQVSMAAAVIFRSKQQELYLAHS